MESQISSPHGDRMAHWDFFWLLVRRDLKTRYAGSTLGGIWNLIHPVAMILIYIAVFSSLFKNRAGSDHASSYAAHLCAGMLVWLVFSDVLGRSVTVLTDNGNFLQKIWFPPALLHASVLFNVLLVYGAGLAALWLSLASLGHGASPAALLVFPLMGLAGLAAMGLGMALSALHVFFRDTAQVISILLQVGFWFNP
ncbi:ABC transporter permease, partial [Candidatus Sumerlaeota bacterium]|nr:ABC transporter permease [Candidatus Sumerlaeota bacterium]